MIGYYIYKITNDINDKIYIGQTTESLKQRFNRHCGYQLNDNTHFHRAMKKYGIEHFSIELVEEVNNQEELDEREFYWINFYNSVENGYNTKNVKGKCGGDTLSNHPNLENIKKKISVSKMGDKNPHARKIKAINIETKEEKFYDSLADCCRDLDIPRHDIISRRCQGKIKKPYLDKWTFCYVD